MLRHLLCLPALIFPLEVLAAVGSWQEEGPVKLLPKVAYCQSY